MNIERFTRISDRRSEQAVLARTCWNLANHLTSGRWRTGQQRTAELTFSQTEQFGHYHYLKKTDDESVEVKPVVNTIALEFYAHKHTAYIRPRSGREVLEAQYRISAAVGQDIDADELPPAVLETLMAASEQTVNEHAEMKSPDEVWEGEPDDDEEDGDDTDTDASREHLVNYIFGEDGEFRTKSQIIRFGYLGEYIEFDYETSLHDLSAGELVRLQERNRPQPVDLPPIDMEVLLGSDLAARDSYIDEAALNLFQAEHFAELVDANRGDEAREHRRSAMAMLALLTSDMYNFSELTKPVGSQV